MKKFHTYILIMCICCGNSAFAQISQGGTPLFIENSPLRSSFALEYIEMPSFNLDSVKQMDELNRQNMRSSFQFAHKFYTDIEMGKQGNIQVLADGTKVWHVGIRSKDAYSINLLFTRFHLPEGGKLFIYSADHKHIIGAFDQQNNSPESVLPVRPVAGDAIIVEYSEPADAAFEGELIIGEVNHDYRDFLRAGEPGIDDATAFSCMPDVLCSDAPESIIRSTVLLIIDGTVACTGSLVNNTKNDETPYLLTAVHCLDPSISFPHEDQYYINKAGTIIAFFNYNRPVCGTNMKATEELSLAGAQRRAIIEKKDVALLELNQKPPVHYNAYYAGWNMDPDSYWYPYTNIHHPYSAVKRYGVYRDTIWSANLPALSPAFSFFDANSHVEVSSWNTGSTHEGSSGSPLFDRDNLIMGTLTAGNSRCSNHDPDYFAAIYLSWYQTNPNLKTYLDPESTNKMKQEGFDPNVQNPVIRLNNANYKNGDQLINTKLSSGFLFGSNPLNLTEFAEEFNLNQKSEVLGVYVLIPPLPFTAVSGVEIEIYEGENAPETLKAQKVFIPQYQYYSNGFQHGDKNTNSVATETFVAFDKPVNVAKKFFVAYKINPFSGSPFAVYNTQFASSGTNSAWLKCPNWIKASEFPPLPTTTALALQPLIRYSNWSNTEKVNNEKSKNMYYDRLSGRLNLTFEPDSPGEIFIYSASGQLLERIPFSKGEKMFKLSPYSNGSLGIVKIFKENEVISKKFVY